eukprot:TRINITY_DN5798_c0_g1_i2.p1 TRINITY_DN5798_c0_g1~~TRINITY_DN5798_c0_g1_i2.p1  ORF type:complete len:166 (+),score=37.31 TRINITY_DN5798_c0_g1_i2:65-499(+)
MASLWERMNGYWRDNTDDKSTTVLSFAPSVAGQGTEGYLKYRRDSYSREKGTHLVASEAGFVKDGKIVLAICDGTEGMSHDLLTCATDKWDRRQEQGELSCANASGSIARRFLISQYTMQVTSITNGKRETFSTEKDNVSWKKL